MALNDYLSGFEKYYCNCDSLSGTKPRMLLLCHNHDSRFLDNFLENIPSEVFDGLVLVDTDEKGVDYECPVHEKLWVRVRLRAADQAREVLLRIASLIRPDWVCLMSVDEIFVTDQCSFISLTGGEDTVCTVFQYVLSDDPEHYYAVPDSRMGVFMEIRAFNMNLCSLEKVMEPDESLYSQARMGMVLFRKFVSSDDKSRHGIQVFTPVYMLDQIFWVAGYYENVGKITDGELPLRIRDKLSRFTAHFLNREISDSISLYSGDSGVALYLAVAYLQSGDEKLREKLFKYLDRFESQMESAENFSCSFCSGLAGYGWLICYLNEKGLVDIGEDYFSDMDTALFSQMGYYCSIGQMDQMHEALSIGRYFLRRGIREPVELLLNVLDRTKMTSFDEIKWETFGYSNKGMKLDFGLAHGMAGRLYFLSKCYRQSIKPDLCIALIRGILAFYDHNEQNFEQYRSYYPGYIHSTDYEPSGAPGASRLAWCYGDAGGLYAMYVCGLYIDDHELQQKAIDKLLVTARRRKHTETGVVDAQFCHGAVSLAQIFNRMYFFTGIELFRETAFFWLKNTLILGNYADSDTGYIFMKGKDKWEICDSLLDGNAGVGLVFLSAFDYAHVDWDESMMLS